MKIYSETSLSSFEFWSGAADTAKYLTDEEFDTIESILEDSYPDGIDETELNDLFWHDDDTIAEWLGYSSFEKLMKRDEEEEIFTCPVCGCEWDNEEDAESCCEEETEEEEE